MVVKNMIFCFVRLNIRELFDQYLLDSQKNRRFVMFFLT